MEMYTIWGFLRTAAKRTLFLLHAFGWMDFVNLGTLNSLIYMLLDNKTTFGKKAPDERKEVYWATAELVKQRLDKVKNR